MKNQKRYQVSKTAFDKTEATALAKAAENLGVDPNQLEAAHTEKSFVFKVKEAGSKVEEKQTNSEYPFGLHTVGKTDKTSLQDAVNSAMEHFETTEGNILRVEEKEDEEYYIFTKVR